jgi:hypothetical protein
MQVTATGTSLQEGEGSPAAWNPLTAEAAGKRGERGGGRGGVGIAVKKLRPWWIAWWASLMVWAFGLKPWGWHVGPQCRAVSSDAVRLERSR